MAEGKKRAVTARPTVVGGNRNAPAAETRAHDFFTCDDCSAAGRKLEQAVGRLDRWSGALIALAPPAAIDAAEEGPPDSVVGAFGEEVPIFTLVEALGWVIRYEAQELNSNVPHVALCDAEWDRLREISNAAARSRPKAVQP